MDIWSSRRGRSPLGRGRPDGAWVGMEIVNGLLTGGGAALLAAWDWVVACCGAFFGWVDAVLNPVLSPLLAGLNPVTTILGDLVYGLLRPFPAWVGLTLISAASGVVLLFAFGRLSNQAAIGRAKDDIKANLLALKLFKEDLGVVLGCQGRLLWAILRLQRYVLTPVLWMTPPMLLALAQMGVRYQWRPLHPEEPTLIRLTLASAEARSADVRLDPSPGLTPDVGPVPGRGDLVWRVRGQTPGRYVLRFTVNGKAVEKELVVSDGAERVSALRCGARWTDQLFHPVEQRLPAEAGVSRIEIGYPSAESWFSGSDYWVVTFFVISMVVALALAPVFRVRF